MSVTAASPRLHPSQQRMLSPVRNSSSPSKPKAGDLSETERLRMAKVVYFIVQMVNVGWNRFGVNYFLANGYTPFQVSRMRSVSLMVKSLCVPVWAAAADIYGKIPTLMAHVVLSACALEYIRLLVQGSAGIEHIIFGRALRSSASAASTVTTALVLDLVAHTSEGFGRQRLFGSIAWGLGCFAVGGVIDVVGLDAGVFYFSYLVRPKPMPKYEFNSQP